MATNGNSWQGFQNIRFGIEHRKAVKKLAKALTEADVLNKLLEYVDDGYKVTITRDEENDAVICSLTGVSDDCVNCGYSMSQRHRDHHVALVALVFAHEELAQRDAWDKVAFDWRQDDW